MTLSRRDFLKTAALTGAAGAVAAKWRANAQAEALNRPEEDWLLSVCGACPSHCGLWGRIVDDPSTGLGRVVKLEGSPVHPINQGVLCPKGQAGLELLYHPDRIRQPLKRVGPRGSGEFQPVSWAEALSELTLKLAALRREKRAHQLAFLLGQTPGIMLDLFRQFAKVYGTPNMITEEALDTRLAQTAVTLTQGIDRLPTYDLENTNYILNFDDSLIEASHFSQRLVTGLSFARQSRPNRIKMVTVGPRYTVTAAKSDEWIQINPGTEGAFALGVARFLAENNLFDPVSAHQFGMGLRDFLDYDEARHSGFLTLVLEQYDLNTVSEITGVKASAIARIAGEFASNGPAVSILPTHNTGSGPGTLFGLMAMHALNALVGSLGVPGGVLTPIRPPKFEMPAIRADEAIKTGLSQERLDGAGNGAYPLAGDNYPYVFQRLLHKEPYPIEVLFLHHADPLYRLPNGALFADALAKVGFIVSVNTFMTDSAAHADLILPDHTYLERWDEVPAEGVGYPLLGLRRPLAEPVYDTRHSGELLLELAQRLGNPVKGALPWADYESLLQARFEALGADWEMVQLLGKWEQAPYPFAEPGSSEWAAQVVGFSRVKCGKQDGRFDFYARELSCALKEAGINVPAEVGVLAEGDAAYLPHYEPPRYVGEQAEYPFVLLPFQQMPFGDLETTPNLPTLQEISGMTAGMRWEPWVEIPLEAADHLKIQDGDPVWVESPLGKAQFKAHLVEAIHPEVIAIPIGWGRAQGAKNIIGRGENPLALVSPQIDPLTGALYLHGTRVKVYR